MRQSSHSIAPPVEAGTLRRPWLAIGLLASIACACVLLGFWQLGRADQSRAAAERFEAMRELPAMRLRTADEPDDALRYRQVEISGRYVPDRQFLLDNVVHDGVVGYNVLTPFEPDDGGRWLLVNRGWVRADPDRRVRPDVSLDPARLRIEGMLDVLPEPGLRLGHEPAAERDAPLHVLSFPTVADLERLLDRPLYAHQLRLDSAAPHGFDRDFPAPGLAPERHLGYAVQWWLFGSIAGGAAAVIGWRVLRRRT